MQQSTEAIFAFNILYMMFIIKNLFCILIGGEISINYPAHILTYASEKLCFQNYHNNYLFFFLFAFNSLTTDDFSKIKIKTFHCILNLHINDVSIIAVKEP